ncbi:uncharacterized protein [Lolium perenne]|uniref:uncharacterized protein n=1 Tax=Lolium perenne TaxID=4522 RepID=UPI003A99ADA5
MAAYEALAPEWWDERDWAFTDESEDDASLTDGEDNLHLLARPETEAAARDRLSELPDHILLNILERVDTMDALRTCILSKRMLQLPAMLSRFDIDVGSLTQHHGKASQRYLSITHVARYNNALAGVTEKILCRRSSEIPIIHKLRVRCYLRPDECLPITRALASTMATQEVENAEFVSLVEDPYIGSRPDERYAKRFNTCLGDCPAAFAGLTRLWLCNMRFGKLDIPNILSTCKRLEHLRLSCCDAGLGSVLLVEHDQLVELIVERGHYEAVHLYRLPKLQCLTCAGWCFPVPLAFGYVPLLSTLSLAQTGISLTTDIHLSQLLTNVPSISELHLDFRSEKIWVVPECPKLLAPVFGKLEYVNLDNLREGCDIAWTNFILEAAPRLRELCITVWDHSCEMMTNEYARRGLGYCEKANVEWQPSVPGLKHRNLVKLTIHGFQPNENMVQYVRNIMKVAVNMREISLHDRKACEHCRYLYHRVKVCPSTYPRTSEKKDMLRVEMTKELGIAALPAVIHFRS